MFGPKKSRKNFEVTSFAWLLAGLVLWVIFVRAPIEAFVVDDPIQIDERSESEALQGASPPCLPCSTDGATWNTSFLRRLRLPSSLAAEDLLAGTILRLKLVRLHPPIGPPQILFAVPVTG